MGLARPIMNTALRSRTSSVQHPAPERDAIEVAFSSGGGVPLDWMMAADLAARQRLILAGGLTPGNVAEAIRVVNPAGVDVASGVERAPGRKDVEKIRAFVAAARAAAQEPR